MRCYLLFTFLGINYIILSLLGNKVSKNSAFGGVLAI